MPDYLMTEADRLARIIQDGGVVLHPTDTVWGFAASCQNLNAIDKIYAIKKRDRSKPLILLVDSLDMLSQYTHNIHPKIENLLDLFERPLTVIYKETMNIENSVLAEDGSIAIRVVKDPFCQRIIQRVGNPIVSTSANISNLPIPMSFEEISPSIKHQVDAISHYGREDRFFTSQPSVLISFDDRGKITFLR